MIKHLHKLAKLSLSFSPEVRICLLVRVTDRQTDRRLYLSRVAPSVTKVTAINGSPQVFDTLLKRRSSLSSVNVQIQPRDWSLAQQSIRTRKAQSRTKRKNKTCIPFVRLVIFSQNVSVI